MKRKYKNPELEVIEFETADIIACSDEKAKDSIIPGEEKESGAYGPA